MNKQDTKQRLKYVYGQISDLVVLRNQSQRHFNDRTLIEFVDDCEKRWNSYTPTREEQGKEDWQSNFFHPTTRNKVKAIIASSASTVPSIKIKATNANQESDRKKADIVKNLVKYSYDTEDLVDSTQTQNFFEALEIVSVGTVITHCTYENITRERKSITSYVVATGEYEFETKKEVVKDQCSDEIVPIDEIYVGSMFTKNGSIQAQPNLGWIKYYTQEQFDDEFGEYKKAKDVKPIGGIETESDRKKFFFDDWSQRVDTAEKGQIEVAKLYSVIKDEYIIVANGVILIDVPMLWEYKKEKVYPFAKTIFEPFATNFFYGNPLPNTLMGEQDIINSLYAMLVDKTYRTLDKQLMVGEANRDAFDLDEQSARDKIIYVNDISQAKEIPTEGVTSSEFNMVNLISRGLDSSSVDNNQSGITGKGVTAREVVIANENAQKLGGIFKMFLSNHWKQKTILRIGNILRFYTQDKVDYSLGLKNPEVKSKIFEVESTELSNGEQGNLNIEMVPEGNPLPMRQELDKKEVELEKEGENTEFIAIRSSFITDWFYDVTVIEDSLDSQNKTTEQAKLENKLKTIATAFPQLFMMNQENFFKKTLEAFGDDPSQYETKMPPPQPAMPEGGPEGQQGPPQQPQQPNQPPQ